MLVEAILVAGGEEANKILEAGAETIIGAVLEAGGEEANKVILEADAEEPNEVIAEEADKAIELVDPEVVAEPFIENLEDPEAAKSREKYYQIDCRTAGGAEVILEADAEQADEAIELGVEAVSEASGRRSHYT